MRIGIVTFHRAYNCGAMLQAWALKKVLCSMGHDVSFPICNRVGFSKRWKVDWFSDESIGIDWLKHTIGRFLINLFSIPCEDILRSRYRRFRHKFIPERKCEANSFGRYYDLLVYGSDQIWHPGITASDTPLFLREVGDVHVRAISYAASYGDRPLSDDSLKRIATALKKFEAISVREKEAKENLGPLTTKCVSETLDPTLLLTEQDYADIAYGSVPDEPYLFMYTVPLNHFFLDSAKELSKRLGVKCIIAPCYQYSRRRAPEGVSYSVSPDRLVQYARNAKYVLAGSFHGTVMGVIFNKPMLSFREQIDACESRPAALLRKLGMANRLVNPTTSLDEMERLLREPLPDYSAALEKERAASLEWLKNAIGE